MDKLWNLVILDRDGVINADSDDYIKSPEEWQALPGSLAAIAALNKLNIPVVVCTNQSGLARGFFDLDTLHAMHDKLQAELKLLHGHIDRIYFCPHHPDEHCSCRKPSPEMYLQAMQDFNVQPSRTVVIGDSLSDLQAAAAAGCHRVLVKTGKGERTLAKLESKSSVEVFSDLNAYVVSLNSKNFSK